MNALISVTKTWRQRRSSSTHCQSISLRRQSSTLAWWNLSIPTKLMIDTSSLKSFNGFRKRVCKMRASRPKAKICTLSYCRRKNKHLNLILASSSSLMKHSSGWGKNHNRLRSRRRLKFMISWHHPPSIKNQYLYHCTHTSKKTRLNNSLTISTTAGTHWNYTRIPSL